MADSQKVSGKAAGSAPARPRTNRSTYEDYLEPGLNRRLPLRRIAEQPRWLVNDLAPMPVELRHPDDYVRGVMLWRAVRQGGYTLLGCRRGRTLYRLARQAQREGVPGALVDCGVWNGGSSALLSAGAPDRELYAFDSFEGFPEPDADLDGTKTTALTGTYKGIEGYVRAAVGRFGSGERLHIVKGWFEETFPTAAPAIGPVAVLHADGDWHDSIRLTLDTFYDQLSPGGYVQVDDYHMFKGARKAVDDFRTDRGIAVPLARIELAVSWRKPAA
jgi:hypothetical protein